MYRHNTIASCIMIGVLAAALAALTATRARGGTPPRETTQTSYYAYGVARNTDLVLMGIGASTDYAVVNIDDGSTIAAGTLALFDSTLVHIGRVHIRVEASEPIFAYLGFDCCRFGGTFFYPSEQHNLRAGKAFRILIPVLSGNNEFLVFAYEDSDVEIRQPDGTLVASSSMTAESYWRPSGLSQGVPYLVTGTGTLSLMSNASNGYDTVPDESGRDVGTNFLYSTRGWGRGAVAVLPYDETDVVITNLDTGEVVRNLHLVPGEFYYESGFLNMRQHLTSTGDVAVWAGDKEGGDSIEWMGDDLSFHNGRAGVEFRIHTQHMGATVFANRDGTQVDVDSVPFVLNRGEFLDLDPGQFTHILSSEPVVVQTIGGNIGAAGDDYGNILRPVPARATAYFEVTEVLDPFPSGVPSDVRVTAFDEDGAVNFNYTGTITFSSSDPLATLPADYTFIPQDNGTHLFEGALSLRTRGAQSVEVSDVDQPQVQGGVEVQVLPIARCGVGAVNAPCGPAAEVLFVNGTAGGTARMVTELDEAIPLSFTLLEPPSRGGDGRPTRVCVYAWYGEPEYEDIVVAPKGLGEMCFGPFFMATRAPRRIFNAIGLSSRLGAHNSPFPPPVIQDAVPLEFSRRPIGVGHPVTATVQGIIEDDCSQAQVPYSVTNGFVLKIP